VKESGVQRTELGVAIIGAGRKGALRAVNHPAVRFVALADADAARARAVAAGISIRLPLAGNDHSSGATK
jgi:predicted dehydrogenase